MNTLYNILVLNQLVVSGLVKVCFSIFDEINDRLENIVQSHGVRNGVDSAIHIPVNLKKIGIFFLKACQNETTTNAL